MPKPAHRPIRHVPPCIVDRRLTWTTRENGQLMVYDSEPGMGPLQHPGIGVLRALPIKEAL